AGGLIHSSPHPTGSAPAAIPRPLRRGHCSIGTRRPGALGPPQSCSAPPLPCPSRSWGHPVLADYRHVNRVPIPALAVLNLGDLFLVNGNGVVLSTFTQSRAQLSRRFLDPLVAHLPPRRGCLG